MAGEAHIPGDPPQFWKSAGPPGQDRVPCFREGGLAALPAAASRRPETGGIPGACSLPPFPARRIMSNEPNLQAWRGAAEVPAVSNEPNFFVPGLETGVAIENEANSPGSWWPREIRSTKLETRNKLKNRMTQTHTKRKTKPIGPAPRAAETTGRAGAPNEPNFFVFGLEMGVAVKKGSQFALPAVSRPQAGGGSNSSRLQPSASTLSLCQTKPIWAGTGPKRHAKAFTRNCLGVNWGNVGVMIESWMEGNQAQKLALGGSYHEYLQGFVGINDRGRYRGLRDGRGQ